MRAITILSVGIISATAIQGRAQSNVYSPNIVGYATVTLPGGYSLIANPLSAGQTNGANEIGLEVPSEQILTWKGFGFDFVSYDPSFGGWIDANFNVTQPPALRPGKGFFFFNPNARSTNFTFVGEVIPGPSSTNNFSLSTGYVLVGSPLPANVGSITNFPISLPTISDMLILQWSGSNYIQTGFDSQFGGWVGADGQTPSAPPPYRIGEGFFWFLPNADFLWFQSLGPPVTTAATAILSIIRNPDLSTVTIGWTTNTPGFILEQSTNLQPLSWIQTTNVPTIVNTNYSVTLPVDAPARFFRLHSP